MMRNRTLALALAAPLFLVLSGALGCGGATAENIVMPTKGGETTRSPLAGPSGDGDAVGPEDRKEGSATTDGDAEVTEEAAKEKDKGPEKTTMTSRGVAAGPLGPPPPRAASVDTSSTPLSGRLSQKDIGDILSRNAALFNDCYTLGASGGQSFTGTVTVKATLGPSGSVTDAQIVKSTARNQKVDLCVIQAFKKIKFPVPKDGGTSVITFPMEFNGVEQVQ